MRINRTLVCLAAVLGLSVLAADARDGGAGIRPRSGRDRAAVSIPFGCVGSGGNAGSHGVAGGAGCDCNIATHGYAAGGGVAGSGRSGHLSRGGSSGTRGGIRAA
jgi:hypothetical protein